VLEMHSRRICTCVTNSPGPAHLHTQMPAPLRHGAAREVGLGVAGSHNVSALFEGPLVGGAALAAERSFLSDRHGRPYQYQVAGVQSHARDGRGRGVGTAPLSKGGALRGVQGEEPSRVTLRDQGMAPAMGRALFAMLRCTGALRAVALAPALQPPPGVSMRACQLHPGAVTRSLPPPLHPTRAGVPSHYVRSAFQRLPGWRHAGDSPRQRVSRDPRGKCKQCPLGRPSNRHGRGHPL
jgi:hypothetical protein